LKPIGKQIDSTDEIQLFWFEGVFLVKKSTRRGTTSVSQIRQRTRRASRGGARASAAMAPALSPTSTFRDDLVGWEHDFDRSAVPPKREADWKPKGPAWDATLRESVERDEGFEWEDQLAVRAREILMSPDRLTRAMGKVLQRGYDQERAGPLARDLARVPSPNKPAWAGLGAVPKDAAPKREADWWAPAELDLEGNHREHARLGATYADGTSPVTRTHDLKDQGVRPGDGGFKSPRRHAPRWAPADPYRGRNALYARIDGEETWWHPRELGVGEWDGDVDGPVERVTRLNKKRGGDDEWGSGEWSSSSGSGEGVSDASYESGDPDAAGSDARRRARREARWDRQQRRAYDRAERRAERRRERADAEEPGGGGFGAAGEKKRGGAYENGTALGGTGASGARRGRASPPRGHSRGSAGKHRSSSDDFARRGARVSDGSRYGGDDRSDGPGGMREAGRDADAASPRGRGGGGGKAARGVSRTEMGTGMDEPEKKRKKRFMLCC
jgi:hypothetical protein